MYNFEMTPIKHYQETDLPWAEIIPLLLVRVQCSQTPQGTSESMNTLASADLETLADIAQNIVKSSALP